MNKSILHQHYMLGLASCLMLLFSCFVTSCEEDLKPYDEPDGLGRVYFIYGSGELNSSKILYDSLVNYSFVYHHNVVQDTSWLRVGTAGFLSPEDRSLELEQVMTGRNDAVSGKHFVSFDDSSYKQLLKVPADSIECDIPIIVLNDASLQNSDVTLKVRLKGTSTLLPGYADFITKRITISARLSKPSNWNMLCDWYLGEYGVVKHQFMIDTSGDPWDDDYLLNVAHVDDYSYQDFLRYQANKFNKALVNLNAERVAQGLDPLSEADGTVVSFPL